MSYIIHFILSCLRQSQDYKRLISFIIILYSLEGGVGVNIQKVIVIVSLVPRLSLCVKSDV